MSAPGSSNRARQRAFTLIEVMIVVVLAGIVLALVSVSAFPDDRSKLRTEADRLAQLWTIAYDEAQVRGTAIVWEADTVGYRFLAREGVRLVTVDRDPALRPRRWELPPVVVRDTSGDAAVRGDAPIRIAFERSSADPIAIELTHGDAHFLVRGDGLGRFDVDAR